MRPYAAKRFIIVQVVSSSSSCMCHLSTQKTAIQAVKKGAAKSGSPTQDGQGEKVVKSRWQPRNGCDSRSMANFLIEFIQVNVSSSQESAQNSPELLLRKFFVIDQPSRPFLGRHLDFTTFSSWSSCVGLPDWAAPYLQLEYGCF